MRKIRFAQRAVGRQSRGAKQFRREPMPPIFLPLDPETVARIRSGGPDANGLPAEHGVSNGTGTPCRCCLRNIPAGEAKLIFAVRPFPALQPYAETGPAFLCARDCPPWTGAGVPPVLTESPDYLVKGYSNDHRILPGTGRITPAPEVADYTAELLGRPETAFVDIRSARNNCWLTRAKAEA